MRVHNYYSSLNSKAAAWLVLLLVLVVGVTALEPVAKTPVAETPADAFDKVFEQGGLTADEMDARMVDAFDKLPPEQRTASFLLERYKKTGDREALFSHPKNVELLVEKLSREEQRKLLAGFQELAPAHEKQIGYKKENSFKDYADEMTRNYLRKTPGFDDTAEGNADFEIARKYWIQGSGKLWKNAEETFKDVSAKVYESFVRRVMGANFVMTDASGNDVTGTFGTSRGIVLVENEKGWTVSNPPSGAYIESTKDASGKPVSGLPPDAKVTALKGEPSDGGLRITISQGTASTSVQVTGNLEGTVSQNDKGNIVYKGRERSLTLDTSLGGDIKIDSSSFFEGKGHNAKFKSNVLTIYSGGRKVGEIEGSGYEAKYDSTPHEDGGQQYVGKLTVERMVKNLEGALETQTTTVRLREGGWVRVRDAEKTVAFIDGQLKKSSSGTVSIGELTKKVLQSIDGSVEFENAHITVSQYRNVVYAESAGKGTLVLVTPIAGHPDVVRTREFLQQFFTSSGMTGSTADLIENAKQDFAGFDQRFRQLESEWSKLSTWEKAQQVSATLTPAIGRSPTIPEAAGRTVNDIWKRIGEHADALGLKDYTDASGRTITKQAQVVGLLDGITNRMFTQEIGRALAVGDVYLGAAGRTKEAAEKGGSLVARALGINPAVAETLVKLADPASNELQDARIAATRPGSTLKIDLELVKKVEPRTFIVASLGAERPVAQGVAVGESRTMFGVGRTTERIAAPRKEQFAQYQEATLHHSGAVVGWASSELTEVWSKPPTEAPKHTLKLEPVVYLEKDTRSTATIETKSDKKNSVERSTLSTVITEATVMNEGSSVYLKDPTGKRIMRRNAEGVLAPVEEKVPAFSVDVKTDRKKTGLPATVKFVDPVTKSTTAVGIHVQDRMLKFGYEKKDELSRADASGKVVQEEKHISYRLDDAYLSFSQQGQLQAVLGDTVRSPRSTGRLRYRVTENGEEVIGVEVPTLNAVVTLDKLNVFDPDGPLVISIKPRSQSGVSVPLNERDGSLQPVVFRVKGYETSASVPLVMDNDAKNGVIEVSSAGVKVNLKAAQTNGKGMLTVTKEGKRQFAAEVEEFVFGLTLEPKGDTFKLENSFVFSPAEEGVQFVPLLGGGAKGKQRITTLVEKGRDTNEQSPMAVVSVKLEGLNTNKEKIPVFAGVRLAGGTTDLYASNGMTIIAPGKKISVLGERPLYLHYGSNGDFELDSGGKATFEFLTDAQVREYEDFAKGQRKAWTSSLLTIKDAYLRGNLNTLNTQYQKAFADLVKAQKEERELIERLNAIEAGKENYASGETDKSLRQRLKKLREEQIPLHASQFRQAAAGLQGVIAIQGAKTNSNDLITLVLLENLQPHIYLSGVPGEAWFTREEQHTNVESVFGTKDDRQFKAVIGTIPDLLNQVLTSREFLKDDEWGLRVGVQEGLGTRYDAFSNEEIAIRFARGLLPGTPALNRQPQDSTQGRFTQKNMNDQEYNQLKKDLEKTLRSDSRLTGLPPNAKQAVIDNILRTIQYYRTGKHDNRREGRGE